MIVVAVWGMAAMAAALPDVFSKYYDEVVIGQKWQLEVTDQDTGETSIATVVLAGDSVMRNVGNLGDYGYAVHVSYDDGRMERYFLSDDSYSLYVFSDKTKSFITIIDYDAKNGKQSDSHWGNHNLTISGIDYVYLADRARARMKLEDPDSGYQTIYLTGPGLNKFEVCSDEWDHNRSYTLIKTVYPDGAELTPSDYESPRIVPDNQYYTDGTMIKYDWMNVPHYCKLFERQLRVVGDTVVCHVPCKRIERWYCDSRTGESKVGEFAVFDIAGQVYSTSTSSEHNRFKPIAVYCLEVGDRMFAQNEETEVTDVFETYIDGVSRRVIKFAQVEEYGLEAIYGYWVEGVGPNMEDGFETIFFFSMRSVLNGLYRDGEQLFRYASLFRTDGIESLQGDDLDGSPMDDKDCDGAPMYNLQGIRIDRPIPGEPYIHNGRIKVSR